MRFLRSSGSLPVLVGLVACITAACQPGGALGRALVPMPVDLDLVLRSEFETTDLGRTRTVRLNDLMARVQDRAALWEWVAHLRIPLPPNGAIDCQAVERCLVSAGLPNAAFRVRSSGPRHAAILKVPKP